MNNSFYIFSSQKLTIERLHLCTWDVRGGKTRFELGIEILNEANNILQSPFKISIHLPFTISIEKVISLHKSLCDEENSRYIFNDIHYCPRNSFNISKSNKLIVTHQN